MFFFCLFVCSLIQIQYLVQIFVQHSNECYWVKNVYEVIKLVGQEKWLKFNIREKNSLMKFSQEILTIIEDEEKLLDSFMIILNNVFMNSKPIYQTSIWSRSQVVYIALTFFTSWLYSDPNIFEMFLESKNVPV